MRKKKLLILFFIFLPLVNAYSAVNNYSKRIFNSYEWKILIESIIEIESKGNPKAINKKGTCVGILQIKKALVDDCNEYLKMKGIKKSYKYNDRKNTEKSIEMFNLTQERYNKKLDIHEAIKIWNGGCNYKKNNPIVIKYYKKVINEFNKRYKQKMEAKKK